MSNSQNAYGESVAPNSVLNAEPGGGALNAPDNVQLFEAEFSRSGQDLIVTQDGSVVLHISDYFTQPVPPDLVAANGAVLRGDIAARLAGSDRYALSAQSDSTEGVNAIGQVELIEGQATVQRIDGTIEPLSVGSKIFQDDILSTSSNGTLSVTFADGTIFSLSPASQMVIDTLIYDQGGQNNAGSFNLLTGGFVFIAGQVAKTGDMDVNTPSATMGIRGTTVQVNMEVNDGITSVIVALNRDPDGSVGSAVLRDLDGELIAILTTTETQWIVSPIEGETREVERTALDLADDSILLDEAIAAFTSANDRVSRGETYVDFGSGQSGGSGSPPVTDDTTPDLEQSPGSDIELGPGGEAPGGTTPPGENGGSGSSPGEGGEDGGAGSFDESNIDNIRGIDSPPQANNVVIVGNEDPADDSQISGQASVQGGDPARLNYAIGTGPENGSASIEPNGVFTYVPDPNFNGTDSFTYIVTGPDGTSDSATVTVEVVPVNDAPVTTDRELGLSEDTQIVGRIEATDADGDRLFFSVGTPAANGRVELTEGGSFIYTPDANFEGTDSFVYRVRDSSGAQDSGTVTIQVDPVNDVPQIDISASSLSGNVGPDGTGAQTVTGTIVIFDPDVGDSFSAVIAPQAATGSLGTFSAGPVLAAATPGTYEVNWTFSIDALSFAALQAGDAPQQLYDLMFTDSTGLTEATTVAVTIEGVNDAPVANDDTASGSEDGVLSGTLLGNDSDIDGDTLSVIANTQPANGSVTVAANGSFTYTPDANFNGTDSFTYTVSDGEGGTDTATVTLQVAPFNDAPVANDDTASGSEDGAISGTLLGNDSDIDGDTLSVIANTQPANGSVTVAANGSFTYTPDANFNGTDSFTYTVSDGEGGTDTATVTLQVAPVNDAPVANDDTASGSEDGAISGTLLGNDSDIDGDALTVIANTQPANGSVTVAANGSFTYTPDANFNGTDSFTYTVSDGEGGTDTATVTLQVAPVNDAPVANDDSASGSEDGAISGTLLGNDSDIDGDALTVIANTQPANGSVTVAANGSFTYTPDANFNGTDSFTYTVSDGAGGTDTATVTLQVAPVNDAPEARGDVASTEESETIVIDVLANDVDLDRDALSVVSAGDGSNGTTEVNPDGTVSYTPDEGFFGVDSFSYTISDGTTETTASVSVVVRQDPADFPDALPAALTFNVDAENGNPAGYVAIEVIPVESNAVNVVFALDSSGSVTAQGWATMLQAVEGAAERLAVDFGNSATELNVHIIAYSTDVASPPSESAPRSFTIASPDDVSELDDLSEYLSELPFQAGWTDWTEALQSAQDYFAAQDPSDANLMYFITDGDPIVFGVEQPASQWAPIAEDLRVDFGVDVTAFGIGPSIDIGNLQLLDPDFDSTTQILTSTDDVTAAFDASPLFNAQLVDFSLILTRDGETVGEIADINVFEDISTGINFELPLANIDGLSGLLGAVNQFTISARFDLNGDPDSTEDQILIVTQATIARNDTAQDREGSEGNDLLLGSDLSDTISGLGGDDLLLGFGGNDNLSGGAGDDLLSVSGSSAQSLDGGAGRDVLTLLTGDNISTTELLALNISGVEALDFENGQANLVTLTESDIFGLSDTGDVDLEALLGGAAGLGETATIYGDSSDQVVLTGQAGVTAFAEDTARGPVTDDDGNELAIYTLTNVGTSEVLATLGIDTDVTVTPVNG